jgi:hypothetical protein
MGPRPSRGARARPRGGTFGFKRGRPGTRALRSCRAGPKFRSRYVSPRPARSRGAAGPFGSEEGCGVSREPSRCGRPRVETAARRGRAGILLLPCAPAFRRAPRPAAPPNRCLLPPRPQLTAFRFRGKFVWVPRG